MKVRADIAEILRAGTHTQAAIARALHVSPITVQRTREALGFPAARRGRPPVQQNPEDAYRAYTEPVDGGHLLWTGPRNSSGVPVIRYVGKQATAYRIGFRLQHGREPRGKVTPGCGMAHCVAGEHLEDRLVRERTESTYAAIFGDPP